MSEEIFYKTLDAGGIGPYSCLQWSLPKNSKPGAWMPKVKEVVECESGYHFYPKKDAIHWLGEEMYKIEPRGCIWRFNIKCAARQARLIERVHEWTHKTRPLFFADCAEHVLPPFEKQYPNDQRVRDCITAVRQFALGDISESELMSASSNVVRAAMDNSEKYTPISAACVTTWAAAWAATGRSVGWGARWGARFSARAVITSTTWYAAEPAAVAAEHRWLTDRLFTYLERPTSESLEEAREKL